jgi:hypothetical protein
MVPKRPAANGLTLGRSNDGGVELLTRERIKTAAASRLRPGSCGYR